MLAGVIIAGNIYVNSTTETDHISGVDYVYALLLWVYLLVRYCTVAALTSYSLAGFLLGGRPFRRSYRASPHLLVQPPRWALKLKALLTVMDSSEPHRR